MVVFTGVLIVKYVLSGITVNNEPWNPIKNIALSLELLFIGLLFKWNNVRYSSKLWGLLSIFVITMLYMLSIIFESNNVVIILSIV